MKCFSSIPLTFILFLFADTLTAQTLRVDVQKDDGTPFPGIIISVNERAVGFTDSLGRVEITYDLLSFGDTIYASCAGVDSVGVLYDEALRSQGRAELVISGLFASLSLDEIVINLQDMEKFFARHTKNIDSPWKNGILSAQFEADIRISDSEQRHIKGTFTVENEVTGKNLERPFQYGLFHHPVNIITDSDTTGLLKLLNLHIHEALRGGSNEIGGALMSDYQREQLRKNYHVHFNYLGKDHDTMKFLVSFYTKGKRGYGIQALLHIDEATQSLLYSDAITIAPEDDGRVGIFKTDHINFRYKKNARPMLMPKNIMYSHEIKGIKIVEIKISDIFLKIK